MQFGQNGNADIVGVLGELITEYGIETEFHYLFLPVSSDVFGGSLDKRHNDNRQNI